MRWKDAREIAIARCEAHPDGGPQCLRWTDLRDWARAPEGFDDRHDGCNERILEAIQMMWIEESEALGSRRFAAQFASQSTTASLLGASANDALMSRFA